MTVASLSPSLPRRVNPARRVEEEREHERGKAGGKKTRKKEGRKTKRECEVTVKEKRFGGSAFRALPRPTVPAVSAARPACIRASVRARGIARRARSASVYTRVCVARAGGKRGGRGGEGRASKRASERLEPQIPFVRASSATAHDSASSLPLTLPLLPPPPLLLLPPPPLLLRSSTHRSPRTPSGLCPSPLPPFWTHGCDLVSLVRSARSQPLASPSVLPLARRRRRSAESVPRTLSRLHRSLPPFSLPSPVLRLSATRSLLLLLLLSRVSPTQGRPEGGMIRGPVKGARKG